MNRRGKMEESCSLIQRNRKKEKGLATGTSTRDLAQGSNCSMSGWRSELILERREKGTGHK